MDKSVANSNIQIPEWEQAGQHVNGTATSKESTSAGFGAKFDRALPPHKRYLGMRRKVFLIVLLAALLGLLALIIGLAAGLSHKSS
jgi:hypothetical protein